VARALVETCGAEWRAAHGSCDDYHVNLDRPEAREKYGMLVGSCLAPITAALSTARRARMFHPDGVVYQANVEPCTLNPQLLPVAERLAGLALVRFSSALWRGERQWPDVLGSAIRFGWVPATPGLASPQDLLLATIRFPWTMPFAPFATNFRSYLWNHYHAVSPFEIAGVGRVKIRLESPRIGGRRSETRAEHLRHAASEGQARFVLQFRRLDVGPFWRHWQPVARVTLMGQLDADQAALRFSPFHSGAGIQPVGFVHALRLATYAASQQARPDHEAP
jgi:hypothetical protein